MGGSVPRLNLRRTIRRFSRVTFASVFAIAWFAPGADADEWQTGLTYETYASWGGSPSLPAPGALPLSTGIVGGLTFNWGGGPVLDSGRWDGVTVRFDGWIRPPEDRTFYLCGLVDDGFLLYLDGQLVINDWWDKGPSCGNTADVDFSDGQPKQMTAWFYENGGGAVAQLLYYTDGGGWAIVPETWYTSQPTATTTTTSTSTSTTTTIPETSTTELETTTTISEPEPTTTLVEETWPPTTESTVPATTVTTIVLPPIAPVIPETTPSTASTPSSTQPATTSQPPETSAPSSVVSSTEPESDPTTVESDSPSEDTLSPAEPTSPEPGPVTPSDPTESNGATTEPPQIEPAITSTSITPTAPPNNASDEQKQEFEATVNVFDGSFDDYIPAGSNVTVAQRRTIVAVTAAISFLAPVPTTRRKG